jgi:hypothetical protein
MMAFDGSDDYVETTSNVGITGASARTLSCWVNVDVNESVHIVNWGGTGLNESFGFFHYVNGSLYFYRHSSGTDTGHDMVEGAWTHIVATYDGETVKTYVNGGAEATEEVALVTTDSHLFIGARMDGSNDYDGFIHQVAIWDAELSASEVTELYNLGLSGDVLTHSNQSNLVSYFKNNGYSADGWRDRKGSNTVTLTGFTSGHDGTPAGSPESIVVREALNADKDGLGFPLDSDSDIIRFSNGGIGLKTDSQTAHNFMKIPFHDGHSLDVHNKAYTIACWARWKQLPLNVSNHKTSFISSYALDNNDGMNLYVYNGSGVQTPVFQVRINGVENSRAGLNAGDLPLSGAGVAVNTWYYIVGTWENNGASGGAMTFADITPTTGEGNLSGAWQASQNHINITQTSTSGSGTGLNPTIATDGSGNPTFSIPQTKQGSGYAIGDTIVYTDPGLTSSTATVTVGSVRINELYIGTSSLAPVAQANGSRGYGESTGNQTPYYNWYVGKMSDHTTSTYYSSAMVDEFRIYNKVLSQAEIDKNWKHGKGKHS